MPNYDTGFSVLPDVGTLSYNGIRFSSLYRSEVHGGVIQDEAARTTKFLEWGLEVEGMVTLKEGDANTDQTWIGIRKRLSAHGAALLYSGNGFGGLNVNVEGGSVWDVAFGPVPKVIHFQPMGAGRGAIVRWQVLVRIPELPMISTFRAGPDSESSGVVALRNVQDIRDIPRAGSVLQYNWESSVTYDEMGYSGLSIRGTLEIPMTRASVNNRTIFDTADAFRSAWMDIQIDLSKFKVTRRHFQTSRDKRTSEFEFVCEEIAPMGLPPGATKAGGTMSVRPSQGGGVVSSGGVSVLVGYRWNVTLRCTYAIRPDFPRRMAAEAFWALLWYRMHSAARGALIPVNDPAAAPQQNPAGAAKDFARGVVRGFENAVVGNGLARGYQALFNEEKTEQPPRAEYRSVMNHFGYDEGLYEDSKTITFEAGWWLFTTFATLLRATGTWRWMRGSTGGNVWAHWIKDVSGWRSWLANAVNPDTDIIVDMGGGTPPQGPPLAP